MGFRFPFSALVGQELLKRALLLGVIQPTLGGVLVRGTKGVAKSTAVRALAGLLPPIETVAGCPFQRWPGEVIADWPLPADAARMVRPVALVELPLGATEDRVLGALHLERALRGERVFDPGLLAAANRGLLYIDEVNLLPDHLVDVLLDAAASGVHRIERDGLSLSHPARFLLIGTMNPEEGDLRPQLLDRFGLVVDVRDLIDPVDRAEAVRRRLSFESNPADFVEKWRDADAAEAERIVQAQGLVADVRIPEAILQTVSEHCLAAGVEGLRADLTVCRAACAWAAYQGRREVEPGDVEAVVELALTHRRTPPNDPGPNGSRSHSFRRNDGSQEPASGGLEEKTRRQGDKETGRPTPGSPSEIVLPSAGLLAPRCKPKLRLLAESRLAGRWRRGAACRDGGQQGSPRPLADGVSLAWAATLRAAAPHQAIRGRTDRDPLLRLHRDDLRCWPPCGPAGCLLLFLLDASGSMATWQRMRQTKAAVLSLLLQAYQRRDRVALLAFRGNGVQTVLPPKRGFEAARQALEKLPAGGATPLAHGLAAARRFIQVEKRRRPDQPIWLVLLTDGRTNVPLTSEDPWQDALAQARLMENCAVECLVVDTETGWPRFGRTQELGRALGADCLSLEEAIGLATLRSVAKPLEITA